jgi:hypothetical protein
LTGRILRNTVISIGSAVLPRQPEISMSKTRVVIWFDRQDPQNIGWAVSVARDDGHGWESDFSGGVDVEDESGLQTVIDSALAGVDVPADALLAANYTSQPDGHTFVGQ